MLHYLAADRQPRARCPAGGADVHALPELLEDCWSSGSMPGPSSRTSTLAVLRVNLAALNRFSTTWTRRSRAAWTGGRAAGSPHLSHAPVGPRGGVHRQRQGVDRPVVDDAATLAGSPQSVRLNDADLLPVALREGADPTGEVEVEPLGDPLCQRHAAAQVSRDSADTARWSGRDRRRTRRGDSRCAAASGRARGQCPCRAPRPDRSSGAAGRPAGGSSSSCHSSRTPRTASSAGPGSLPGRTCPPR
jgi:hypothetical protein